MRTKKFIYNVVSAALYQVFTLLFGLILPRLFIITYGSEINGLISSVVQFVSYFQYIEFGLGATLIFALYKPLATEDYSQINNITTTARKSYIKASLWYFMLVVGLSLIYPLVIKRESINLQATIVLIIVIGAYGALDFYTLAKYRVLLTADQRYYVVNITSIVALILNFIITVVLIQLNANIIIVKAVPLVTFFVRSSILRAYVKKRYPNLSYCKAGDYKVENDKRWDALIFQLSMSIMTSLPIVIVSIISLKSASVFSIYSMIFIGVTGILSVFTMGSSASFGNIIANNESETLKKINNEYEFSLYFIESILFSAALILCTPFIQIYTKGIEDAVYSNSKYVLLFVIWGVIFNARLPQTAIVNGAGIYRETRNANVIQIILFIGLAVILANRMNIIIAVLIVMIIAAAYRTLDLIIVVNKTITKNNHYKSVLRLGRIFLIIFLAYIPFIYIIKITCITLTDWLICAGAVIIWCGIITIAINLIFDKQVLIESAKRLIAITYKKNKTSGF